MFRVRQIQLAGQLTNPCVVDDFNVILFDNFQTERERYLFINKLQVFIRVRLRSPRHMVFILYEIKISVVNAFCLHILFSKFFKKWEHLMFHPAVITSTMISYIWFLYSKIYTHLCCLAHLVYQNPTSSETSPSSIKKKFHLPGPESFYNN